MKDKDFDQSLYLCGIGSWRPKWMQRLAKPSVFLVVLGITSLIQGGSYTYFIASLTTLEKRYAFSSKISGLILIADNIPELTLGPVFGYLATRVHRPRLLACTQIIVGLGLFLAALPYFIYGPAVHLLTTDPNILGKYSTNRTVEFCDIKRDSKCLDENSGSNTVVPAVVMIWFACFFNGFGSSAYFSVGVPFVDDSVKKKNSALFISASAALRILGPTIGFMLSSLCLTFYEDPSIDPGIRDRKDPRWVGAWWIGFVVLGVAITLAALPLLLFPAELNEKHRNQMEFQKTKRLLKVNKTSDSNEEPGIWIRTKRLLKNPIYMCYMIGTNVRLFAVLGYWTFKSKYMESEYKKSASTANLFSGIIGVIPTATGIFLGGFFIHFFRPRPRVLTSFITIVEVLALMGMFSALFLGCPASEFTGTQMNSDRWDRDQTKDHYNMQTDCNTDCTCSQKTFQPICGPDKKTNYFSPCFAGCTQNSIFKNASGNTEYQDCKCFSGTAEEGYCDNNCGNNFAIYATLLGISSIIGNLAKTGNSIIALRVVDPIDKSFSVGLGGAFLCLFAFIPYPLVYGAVTDSTCLIWEESCGRRGNCWFYDSNKFRNYLHGLTLALYLTGSLFDVIVVILSNRIKKLYDDEDVVDDQAQNYVLSSNSDNNIELN